MQLCWTAERSPGLVSWSQVLQNSDNGGVKGSLLWFLSQVMTRGGGNLLRHWATHPLTDLAAIKARLGAVDQFQALFSSPDDGLLLPKLPEVLTVRALLEPELVYGVAMLLTQLRLP